MIYLVVGVLSLVWFFLPVSMSGDFELLRPFSMGSWLSFLTPLVGIYNITAYFLKERLGRFSSSLFLSLLLFLSTGIMFYLTVNPVLGGAESIEFFDNIPSYQYVILTLVILANILSVILLLREINRLKSSYREYVGFRKSYKGAKLIFRIRTKLILSFVAIITVIIVILTSQLLNNYRGTLLKAISDGANNQVEQSSATYRVNLGDNIALFEYLKRQLELNDRASFKYDSLSIYTNFSEVIYLEDETTPVEEYPLEYSTLSPEERNPELPALTNKRVEEYLNQFRESSGVIEERVGGVIRYISPIIKMDTVKVGDERVKKQRFLGLSLISFSTDVIMKPFFKVRNLVFLMTAVFIYISIILVYLVGNLIVTPILFLRMNVKQVSNILTDMIQGNIRVNAQSLLYSDSINSRDEIKYLSNEINDMVTVIRGIIPYISASTLKHADRDETVSVEKEITFLFTDIRGFTTMCEGMSPQEVVDVLNRYLNIETEIIHRNHGDVDKFVGDEMMAFFEGPDKELNACRAAMEIRHAMMEEKEHREKMGLPVVDIGIGINSGKVIFGSVGAKDRMDFTSIGDTVNLAARLEGANKAFGSKTIISEDVFELVKEHFLCRELDSIAVKGKNIPVRIYEIIQDREKSSEKLEEIITLFETGLRHYRAREWESAIPYFQQNVKLYNDNPSQIFIDRIEHFKINTPDREWDGVFVMTVK